MKCRECKTEMTLRSGQFGNFYFCPEQYNGCKQKTISEEVANDIALSRKCRASVDVLRVNDCALSSELQIMEAQQSILFSAPSKLYPNCERPFDPDLDDPIYDDGSDYRPY